MWCYVMLCGVMGCDGRLCHVMLCCVTPSSPSPSHTAHRPIIRYITHVTPVMYHYWYIGWNVYVSISLSLLSSSVSNRLLRLPLPPPFTFHVHSDVSVMPTCQNLTFPPTSTSTSCSDVTGYVQPVRHPKSLAEGRTYASGGQKGYVLLNRPHIPKFLRWTFFCFLLIISYFCTPSLISISSMMFSSFPPFISLLYSIYIEVRFTLFML